MTRSAPDGGQDIGDQLGRDRLARAVLLLLPGIAEVRQHGGNPVRAGPPHGVNEDQQFDQIGVHRRAGRLDDESIRPAHALVILHIGLAVGEPV